MNELNNRNDDIDIFIGGWVSHYYSSFSSIPTYYSFCLERFEFYRPQLKHEFILFSALKFK